MKLSVAGIAVAVSCLAIMQTSARAEIESVSEFKLPPAGNLPEQQVTENPTGPASAESLAERSANSPADEHGWSLPIEGLLRTAGGGVIAEAKEPKRLDASIVSADSENAIGAQVEALTDLAWTNDGRTGQLDTAVAHYRTVTQRAVAQAKDTADYLVPFRGSGPSSEAGDVILDEKVKLKSRASAEFARQKCVDELHLKVATDVLQIALGLGMSDAAKRQAAVDVGTGSLRELVGEEESTRTVGYVEQWTRDVKVPAAVFRQAVWDVTRKQANVQEILKDALQADPVVGEITRRLHKYNQHGKFARASSHVIQTTLGIAALTPDLVGAAAKSALVAYVTATGGPEQCKLLKELYLDKRFESRWKALSEQAHLAVENYEVALLTHNAPLLVCSESLVEQMAGRSTVKAVFGQSVLAQATAEAGARL